MDRNEFKRSILGMHQDQPQRRALVDLTLNGLFECLDKLATWGHALEVRPAEFMFGGEEFPKMMWHPEAAPQGKVFHTQESVPQDVGWSDRPLGQQEEPQEEGEQEEGDSESSRPLSHNTGQEDTSGNARAYPKKLFHPDLPGGTDVQNAEMEDDFRERGYTDTPPNRGDVNFGSTTRRFEGTDGGPPERGQLGRQTPQTTRPAVPSKRPKGA